MQKIGFYITLAVISLFPLFFLPVTSDFYDFNKFIFLSVATIVLTILWGVSLVIEKQVKVTRSPLGLPLLFIAASWIASTVLRSPNKLDSFINPGETGTVIVLCLFVFIATNFFKNKKEILTAVYSLMASIGVLSLITIFWGTGLAAKIIPASPNLEFLRSVIWAPTGSLITTILAIAGILPLIIVILIKDRSSRTKSLILSAFLLINITAITVGSYRLFNPPTGAAKPVFLSIGSSWSIALESLKTSPLLGTGPGTFTEDFTRFKPNSENSKPSWNLRFNTGFNQYLNILTTVGILGLVSYAFLVLRTFYITSKAFKLPNSSIALAAGISALFIFATQLVLPGNLTTIGISFFLLTLCLAALKQLGTSMVHDSNIDIVASSSTGNHSTILAWIILALILIVSVPSSVVIYKVYLAEVLYHKALVYASQDNGKATYDTLLRAITTNPYRDTYRLAYSQTNFLLANSIASNQNLKDEDRNTVTQLIQRAIQEAKNAVALNPNKVANAENLGNIYRNLLNFAQGADSWTIAAYQQAIVLDPLNPSLRITLGSVYYTLKNYDDAIRILQTATDLKPDFANAHYNLSLAYSQKGDYPKAVTEMQTVTQLVDSSSADFTKAQEELAALKKKVGETTPPATPSASQLTKPEQLPTPKITPPIKLEEATPSATP